MENRPQEATDEISSGSTQNRAIKIAGIGVMVTGALFIFEGVRSFDWQEVAGGVLAIVFGKTLKDIQSYPH